jgi:hypothetical protein
MLSTFALANQGEMARPTGVERAIATHTLPIGGRDEWLAAVGQRRAYRAAS